MNSYQKITEILLRKFYFQQKYQLHSKKCHAQHSGPLKMCFPNILGKKKSRLSLP
jgi:hypothetical protein